MFFQVWRDRGLSDAEIEQRFAEKIRGEQEKRRKRCEREARGEPGGGPGGEEASGGD